MSGEGNSEQLQRDADRMSCTVDNVIHVLKEKQFSCNLRILGSQLGLTTSDLDSLVGGVSEDRLLQDILDTCSQRGLLNWRNIVDALNRPALSRSGKEAASQILSDQCRRGSSTSVQSVVLSPVSVTSDSHPFQKSLSLDTAEELELTVPNVVNKIYSDPRLCEDPERLKRLAHNLKVSVDFERSTCDEIIQRLVEEWLRDRARSCEEFRGALTDSRCRRDTSTSLSSSLGVNVNPGILGTEDLQHVRSFIWESRNRWKDIGLSLGMKYHDLDCISTKHRENPDECFTEMLHKWISSNEATWAGLAKALKHKTVGYEQLAETIELNLRQNEISRIMSESMTVMSNGDGNATRTQRLLAPPDSGKVSFRCPCDKCTLESYLEKGCSKHRSLAYPYLDIERLSEDEQEDLIATLDSDTTDIKRNFAELCNNLSASLKGRRKSAKELVNVITSIDKSLPKELETKTDIDSVFIVLNKRVSFFNYETIGHIVKQLGNKKDKKKMKEYTKKFTEFCKRRVFEVQPGAYESSAECPGRKKFVVLAFKEIDVDSAVSTAKEIQRNIAKLLDIRSSDLQLHRIDKGSVILVFSVPNSVAQDLFPLNQQVIREVEAAGFVVCVPHTTNTNSPSKTPGIMITKQLSSPKDSDQDGKTSLKHPTRMYPQLEELEKRFNNLLLTTEAELTVGNESIELLTRGLKVKGRQMPCTVDARHYQYLTNIISGQIEQFQCRKLFHYVNMYCWSCLEHHLLSSIVDRNQCSQRLINQMKTFERDSLEFKRTMLISSFAESQYYSTEDLTPPHFDHITTQHNLIDAAQKEHTLVELESFRFDVVSRMNLPIQCALQIIAIKQESMVEVEWRIPSELLEDMTTFFCSDDGQSIVARHHITHVVIDGRHPMERQALKRLLDTFDEEGPVDENTLAGVENVNTCNKVGKSFLSIAAGYGRVDIMDLLVRHGADVNYQNKDMQCDTALMVACEWGQVLAVEYLIDRKANVNYVNKDGWTPLMTAVDGGHKDVVQLLIRRGDVFIDYQNKEGRTALCIASWMGDLDIANLLLSAGAQSNCQDQDGLTALHLATQNGFKGVIEALLSHGADPNITEIKTGRSSIFIAAEQGCWDIIEMLMTRGAKLDLKDKDNMTVLDVATECNHTHVCMELQKYIKQTQDLKTSKSKKQKVMESIEKTFLRSRYKKSKQNQGDVHITKNKNITRKRISKARMLAMTLLGKSN